jgi:transcriptional regulator with XRE-family HTH domain
MEVKDTLKKIRKEKGLTQKKLAELSGLSLNAIRKYESGERHPKIENYEKLQNALGLKSVLELEDTNFIKRRFLFAPDGSNIEMYKEFDLIDERISKNRMAVLYFETLRTVRKAISKP